MFLELDGGHPDTEVIDREDVVHHLLTFSFEVDALGPKHTENGAIAHELVDHRLRDVADGFVPVFDIEQPRPGIIDAVLDDP